MHGRPRGLIDAGGGAFVRLGELGVFAAALDWYLLTHTHIDHTGGLAPVVFASVMEGRTEPMAVVGPTGRDGHPGCERFCDLLFGESGAWSYLQTFEHFSLRPFEVPHSAEHPQVAYEDDEVTVRAVGVAHGMMPSVAYRVEVAGRSLVISGDLEGTSPPLAELARGCDLLVHDQALPRRDLPHGHLHSPPEETGANAQAAGAATLVLSHLMPQADPERARILERVSAVYSGRVFLAEDRCTFELNEGGGVVVRGSGAPIESTEA